MIPNDRCCPPGSLMAGWLGSTLSLTILKREEKKNWQNALSVYVMQWPSVHCSPTGITTHKSLFFFLREPPSPRTRRMYVSPSLTHTSLKVTNCRRLPAVFSRSPSFYFLAVNVGRSYFFWATFESKDARQTLSIELNLPLPFFFFFWWI